MKYLKEQAYATIRERIINCEYEPGSVLNETLLMNELGISRTPIREALNRLSMENLVQVIPKKGIIVSGISLSDIVQSFDARIMVEPLIVQEYGSRFERSKLEEYLNACENAVDMEEMIRLDETFHAMTRQICANRYLRELLAMAEGVNHRNRIWRSNEDRVHISLMEHIAIVKALLEADYDLARRRMLAHLQNAREYAIKKYY